jgi:ATP-grasp domain
VSSESAGALQPERDRPAPHMVRVTSRQAAPGQRTLVLLYADPQMRRRLFADLRPWLDERGLRVVLADDELGEPDRALFHELIPMPPPQHLAQAVDRLCSHAARHPVDAIVAESELALLPGALASARLGLPHVGLHGAHLVTNKWACRSALQAAGVPVPSFALGSDAADVRRFGAEHGYPLLLKATASSMSRLVLLVREPRDAGAAASLMLERLPAAPDIARLLRFTELAGLDPGCDPLKQFLIEKYCEGEQLEVDGLVVGGEPRAFGVTALRLSPPPRFFVEGYLLPAELPAGEGEALERTALAAVAALQLQDAGFCVELRRAAGGPVVIEVNGRLGQDEGLAEMFDLALGEAPLRLWLEVLGCGRRGALPRPRRAAALAYVCHYDDATVLAVPAARREPPRADGCSLEVQVVVQPGDRVRGPPDVQAFPHLACALASHLTSSGAAFMAARAAADGLRFRLGPLQPPPREAGAEGNA